MTVKRNTVVSRIDHGLNHKPTDETPTRYELHFDSGMVLYSNALPDTSMFALSDDKSEPV